MTFCTSLLSFLPSLLSFLFFFEHFLLSFESSPFFLPQINPVFCVQKHNLFFNLISFYKSSSLFLLLLLLFLLTLIITSFWRSRVSFWIISRVTRCRLISFWIISLSRSCISRSNLFSLWRSRRCFIILWSYSFSLWRSRSFCFCFSI